MFNINVIAIPNKTYLVWFRFWRIKTSPWITLAIAFSKILYLYGQEREKEKLRLMSALVRIDALGFYGFMNDLLF